MEEIVFREILVIIAVLIFLGALGIVAGDIMTSDKKKPDNKASS